MAKEAPAKKVVKESTQEPSPVIAKATNPGTHDVHIEIMAGSQPITIDLVDGK